MSDEARKELAERFARQDADRAALIEDFVDRLDRTVCRSGCPTQDHASYRECLKAAHFGIAKGETAKGQY